MRVLFILGSSSSSVASTPPHHQHSRHSKHSKHYKPSASKLSPSTVSPRPHSSSQNSIDVSPRFPLRSIVPWDLHPSGKNYLTYYADLASKLAQQGKLEDFSMLLESVIGAGVEASQFASELNAELVAKGISRCLREEGVWSVVQVVRKVSEHGIDPLKFLDGSAMESLRRECRLLGKRGDVEQLVELMAVLAGFHFPVKELIRPSDVIKICVDQRNPTMSIRYASILPDAHYLYCTVITEFGKKRDLGLALVAYAETNAHLSGSNMYILRSIIDVCGLCGDYVKSRYIYEDLLRQKITPNIYVFNSLMNVNAHDLSYTFDVYKEMQNLGVTADLASYNILLKSCFLAERVDLAKDIYKEIQHLESIGILKLDVFTYSTIVKVFADAKLWQMALKVKEDMQSAGVTPNVVTWSSLINACANSGLVELAIKLFEEMISSGCEPNTQCCNILLHACVEASQYDRAFRFFHSWKERQTQVDVGEINEDCISNTLTSVNSEKRSQLCSSNKKNSPNVRQLTFAKGFVFKPTTTTYNILMKACGTDYYRVKALMEEMKTFGLAPNHISWSILLDITGTSGNAEGAIQILKTMHSTGIDPDVVAFTTAIKVCMESKQWNLAFSLFEEMKRFEIQPNKVTYSTLLGPRGSYGSLYEVQQCLAIYQDMRKAGYNSDDHYLKELIEEWCEGVIQNNNHQQGEYSFSDRTASVNPQSLLLEKVAEHLQKNFSETITIDLHGLTKVEARIVVLAVLRMIKENYALGQEVKDDIIILGVGKDGEMDLASHNFGVKAAITKLLLDELQLNVVQVGPRIALDPSSSSSSSSHTEGGRLQKVKYSTRRPYAVQRLKITRKSLHHWLQKNKVPVKKLKVIFS